MSRQYCYVGDWDVAHEAVPGLEIADERVHPRNFSGYVNGLRNPIFTNNPSLVNHFDAVSVILAAKLEKTHYVMSISRCPAWHRLKGIVRPGDLLITHGELALIREFIEEDLKNETAASQQDHEAGDDPGSDSECNLPDYEVPERETVEPVEDQGRDPATSEGVAVQGVQAELCEGPRTGGPVESAAAVLPSEGSAAESGVLNEFFHRGSAVYLRSGRYFDVFNPRKEDFKLSEIAWGLSRRYRFGGQSQSGYTVAQHCVECYRLAKREQYNKAVLRVVLLHDAAEAFLGDMQRPSKASRQHYSRRWAFHIPGISCCRYR